MQFNTLPDLTSLSAGQLLRVYGDILEELRRRSIVRSANNPVADVAEDLVARALGLERAPPSTTGYDCEGPDGRRYEVKAVRQTENNRRTQLSAIRGLPEKHFHFLVGVRFASDFSVSRAALIPYDVVVAHARFVKHSNSWLLHLRDSIWDLPGVEDITAKIKQVQS